MRRSVNMTARGCLGKREIRVPGHRLSDVGCMFSACVKNASPADRFLPDADEAVHIAEQCFLFWEHVPRQARVARDATATGACFRVLRHRAGAIQRAARPFNDLPNEAPARSNEGREGQLRGLLTKNQSRNPSPVRASSWARDNSDAGNGSSTTSNRP